MSGLSRTVYALAGRREAKYAFLVILLYLHTEQVPNVIIGELEVILYTDIVYCRE